MEQHIKYPVNIIDIHCHLFNLKYLPVAGIILRYGDGLIPHIIAKGVEALFLRQTGESFPQAEDSPMMVRHEGEMQGPLKDYLGLSESRSRSKDVRHFSPSDTVEAMMDMAVVGDVVRGEMSNAIDAFMKMGVVDLPEASLAKARDEFSNIEHRAGLLKRMLDWIIGLAEDLRNNINWFVFMTKSEEDIYRHVTGTDQAGVTKFLFLMMDVDHFFNAGSGQLKYRSRFDFKKVQIPNMKQMLVNHDNLVGFVAFNPARGKESLIIVKDAIENHGFRGVKFYPPMGYKPAGDDKYAKEIDELFAYCEKENVPVFTHCNNAGFQAWPKQNSGYCSNPKYWEKALVKYPKLRLCLGHGGGGEGWFAGNKGTDKLKASQIVSGGSVDDSKAQKADWNHSYAAMVFKLCTEYPNVYCDAAYLDEMIKKDGNFDEKLRVNFKTRLLKLFNSEPAFAGKMMYGSDWHMLFREGKNKVYLSTYLLFFSDAAFDDYRDSFFSGNAIAYLNGHP